ncbi:inactive phospholipase D5 isoform X1 [Brienomyrus brachyistius]|uniref:inactive phospholipase D5 isoform X1 n=1 Tax=Brienomyrus brachyistius TaxID=42636 RepID=UPI0020B309D0|nr:inactive phospholipase D5 isoform X1 [Brienomyrus brachyistius]
MDVKHGQLPIGGFEHLQLKGRLEPPGPAVTRMGNTVYSTVQQQDYSASVWLSRRDKLEHSQQKCVVIFALVCCFAVLVALIFSAVDIWGGDEDGITEDNCSTKCRIVLVENIPEDITFSENGTSSTPLSVGLHKLLDLATRSVEIVSSHWALTSADLESGFSGAEQGHYLFQRLLDLKSRQVSLKVASGPTNSSELRKLSDKGADVRYLNMSALTRGHLHSTFWVVDRQHIYIGSANMDWRSFSKMKELGVVLYNCSCLALDLHRVFSLYSQLQYKDYLPSIWSKRLTALYNKEDVLKLQLNSTKAEAYVSSSPDAFCPKDRTRDIDAISHVIQEAKRFIYISITEYLPLINRSLYRYWSRIDEMLREALILRAIKVRLLISCSKQTHPLTFNFVWSLKTLCMELANCTLQVKFFNPREQKDGTQLGINHNKFMVTDSSVYIGNFDWVGNEFLYNAGVGLVISQAEGVEERNTTIVEQVKAAFERDWYSRHTKSLQANKIPECGKHRVGQPAALKAQMDVVEGRDASSASL